MAECSHPKALTRVVCQRCDDEHAAQVARLEAKLCEAQEKLAHLEGKASDNDCPYLADKIRAEAERDAAERSTRWASQFECPIHGTCDWSMVSTAKTCMATLSNGQPCEKTLRRGSSPWDAAIERAEAAEALTRAEAQKEGDDPPGQPGQPSQP